MKIIHKNNKPIVADALKQHTFCKVHFKEVPSNNMLTDTDLINYLHTLTEQLRDKTLNEQQKRDITMMFLRHRYTTKTDDTDETKQLNYVSLGWYIYEFLLKK